jgi:hypothetical protein
MCQAPAGGLGPGVLLRGLGDGTFAPSHGVVSVIVRFGGALAFRVTSDGTAVTGGCSGCLQAPL